MNIIDAHIHFYPDEYFDRIAINAGHINSAEHLQEIYNKYHIKRAVVMGNRDLRLENHQYPEFLSYCVGMDSSNFKEKKRLAAAVDLVEEHLRRESCVGIKLYPGYNPFYVSDPVYTPFYELAQSYNKPVAIHTGATASSNALLKYSHPLTVDDVATAFPQVKFVMCHLGNPWIVDAVAVMSKNENVAADLSGILEGVVNVPELLQSHAGYVEHLKTWLAYLGSYDRLLYGTDWPLVNVESYIHFVEALIPKEHHQKVFFQNANRIYNLNL